MAYSNYTPKSKRNTRTPATLYIPTYTKVNGVQKKAYPAAGEQIFISFKSYGGTDSVVNGVYSVIETARITLRYRPDVKSDCRIALQTGAVYEIVGEPENIDMANQWLSCKVQRIKGGA